MDPADRPISAPMRVLQVVENLDRGSVETWLLRMAAHARRRGIPIDWTFYCALGVPGSKDEMARDLGAQVVHAPVAIGRKTAFAKALRAEIRAGRYEVLHAHHDLVSGLYLAAALGLPLRRRIVHVHNADEQVLTDNPLKKAVLRPVLRRTCLALADRIVANSNYSLDTFLAGRRRRPGRDIVHYLGVEALCADSTQGARRAFRLEHGLDEDAPILLFAGRMTPEKGPVFVADVLFEIRKILPAAVAVFVGEGSLEQAVHDRARDLDVADAVRCLGWRRDVPEIMGVCDWFILPHPEHPPEAFGLAVVEAQLAGLRLLLSSGILDDPLLPTATYRRLSLKSPASMWARAAVELLDLPRPSLTAAQASLKASPMDMDFALDHLLGLYC